MWEKNFKKCIVEECGLQILVFFWGGNEGHPLGKLILIYTAVLLLMVEEIQREQTSLRFGSWNLPLFNLQRGFVYLPGAWPWDFWSINSYVTSERERVRSGSHMLFHNWVSRKKTGFENPLSKRMSWTHPPSKRKKSKPSNSKTSSFHPSIFKKRFSHMFQPLIWVKHLATLQPPNLLVILETPSSAPLAMFCMFPPIFLSDL